MRILLRTATVLFVILALSSTAQAATTTTKIGLDGDGSAAWTVEIRERLETQGEVEAFRNATRDTETSQTTLEFRDRLNRTVSRAAEETGREMSVENFSASAEVEGLSTMWGVVRYRFTWIGFAERTDSTLAAGDAIEGYYLDSGDVLTVTLPEDFRVERVRPGPDDETTTRSVTWEGPKSFGSGEPSIEAAAVPQPTREPTSPPPGRDGFDAGIVLILLLLAAATGVVVYLYVSRASSVEPEGPSVEEAPIPDDERVLRLLEESGGRMRQADVSSETGWSDAKVSNVTNRLVDEGRILKRRWGREKVLLLPEDED